MINVLKGLYNRIQLYSANRRINYLETLPSEAKNIIDTDVEETIHHAHELKYIYEKRKNLLSKLNSSPEANN